MTALTREPSLRRASTSGDDSSMRRPSGVTMRSMTARTRSSSVKRASVCTNCPPLDVDRARVDDHDLVHAGIGEEALERAEPERLVGELADEHVTVDARRDARIERASRCDGARSRTLGRIDGSSSFAGVDRCEIEVLEERACESRAAARRSRRPTPPRRPRPATRAAPGRAAAREPRGPRREDASASTRRGRPAEAQ